MKQVIVLFAMIVLGVYIFGMLMGEQESSVFHSVKNLWQNEIEGQKVNQ